MNDARARRNAFLDMVDAMRWDHVWLYAMIEHQRKVSAMWATTRASSK